MFKLLEYPNIDPVLFQIGPFALRWYSIAYILGIVLGSIYADWLNKKDPVEKELKIFDDFIVWAVVGIIIGGRLGYVLFYNFSLYLQNPIDIIKVWQGGMSFHGGFLGVTIAAIIYAKKKKVNLLILFDLLACAAPIGLFFGRISNFINGELYGRVTSSKLGVVFPNSDGLPRHPSQLYEALLEGLVLFIVLLLLANFSNLKKIPGVLAGIFVSGYGISRFVVEYFREPDAQIGLIFGEISLGQILSLPMVLVGIAFIIFSFKRNNKLNG